MESNGSYFLNQRTLKHVIQQKYLMQLNFFFRPVLFKFKTLDEWQHWKTGSPALGVEVQLAEWMAENCHQNETDQVP